MLVWLWLVLKSARCMSQVLFNRLVIVCLSTILLQSVPAGMSSVKLLLHQQSCKNKQLNDTFVFSTTIFLFIIKKHSIKVKPSTFTTSCCARNCGGGSTCSLHREVFEQGNLFWQNSCILKRVRGLASGINMYKTFFPCWVQPRGDLLLIEKKSFTDFTGNRL